MAPVRSQVLYAHHKLIHAKMEIHAEHVIGIHSVLIQNAPGADIIVSASDTQGFGLFVSKMQLRIHHSNVCIAPPTSKPTTSILLRVAITATENKVGIYSMGKSKHRQESRPRNSASNHQKFGKQRTPWPLRQCLRHACPDFYSQQLT